MERRCVHPSSDVVNLSEKWPTNLISVAFVPPSTPPPPSGGRIRKRVRSGRYWRGVMHFSPFFLATHGHQDEWTDGSDRLVPATTWMYRSNKRWPSSYASSCFHFCCIFFSSKRRRGQREGEQPNKRFLKIMHSAVEHANNFSFWSHEVMHLMRKRQI